MTEKAVEVFIEDLVRRRKLAETSKNDEKSHILFQGLSENSLQTLLSSSHMKEISAGQQILQQGDTPENLYYILEGKVKTQRFSLDGAEVTIRLLGKGETFMDAVIFMGGKSPVGAQTTEDCRFLMIPAETVRRQAFNDSQFACNLLQIVTRHYKTAIQQIDSITIKNPIERLGYYFLKLHIENGSNNMDITLPFKKSMIANHLGMTPETFSRTLNQIKKMNVNINQGKLTMRDAYALCHFCDPDTANTCSRFGSEDCPISEDNCGGGKCH
ncbi:MAG: Crp/Fnr family transcriptional regulator [Alphaproteobacteria bacterium CG_4_9_14_3_um_filter_47_13]|nr:MAG: Crp/Fnr family transcriptional regulator [Alphaproteobacteria bacterium CG_4_9_14_3_um_filter_47_13]